MFVGQHDSQASVGSKCFCSANLLACVSRLSPQPVLDARWLLLSMRTCYSRHDADRHPSGRSSLSLTLEVWARFLRWLSRVTNVA